MRPDCLSVEGDQRPTKYFFNSKIIILKYSRFNKFLYKDDSWTKLAFGEITYLSEIRLTCITTKLNTYKNCNSDLSLRMIISLDVKTISYWTLYVRCIVVRFDFFYEREATVRMITVWITTVQIATFQITTF